MKRGTEKTKIPKLMEMLAFFRGMIKNMINLRYTRDS